mgnify:CR=1 FL=1
MSNKPIDSQIGYLHIRSVDALRYPIFKTRTGVKTNGPSYYYTYNNKKYSINERLFNIANLNPNLMIVLSTEFSHSSYTRDLKAKFPFIHINGHKITNNNYIEIPEGLHIRAIDTSGHSITRH